VATASSARAGTAIGRTRGRAVKGEYTRGGTRQDADAASTCCGEGEGNSPGRKDKRSADAAATMHP